MNLLAKGAAWLARTRTQYASRYVTYQRGNSSVSVRATPGRTNREIQDNSGLFTTVTVRDELILIRDLVIDGQRVEPKAGDQIIDGDPSEGITWQVAPLAAGQAPFTTDDYRQHYRIHLQLVQDDQEV